VDRVISVLLVDDDPLVRSALTLMLGGQGDIEVVGEAANGREGVELVGELAPDVVLMDIRMPVMDGLEATQVLHAQPAPPAVVVLTTFDADDHVVRAVAAGADGFLLKDTPPLELVQAVRVVAAGDSMLSPSVTRRLIDHVASSAPAPQAAVEPGLADLSAREREVLVELATGASNAEIGATLFMSEATVKAHVTHLLTKLGRSNRVQLAILAHDAGLTR
jgi:DNA-binding NarL/FixJ family response regulator